MFRISQTRSLDISVPEPLIRTKFCNRSQKTTSIIMRSFRLLTKFLLITDSFRAAAKPSIIDEHCFADVEGEGFKVSNLASRPLSDLEKQKELCECKQELCLNVEISFERSSICQYRTFHQLVLDTSQNLSANKTLCMFNYLNATYCDPWKEKYNKAGIEIMHIIILSIVGIVMFGIFVVCRPIRHNQPLLQDRIDEGEAPQRSWGIGLSIEGGLDELQPGLYEIEPGQVENLEYNQEGGI